MIGTADDSVALHKLRTTRVRRHDNALQIRETCAIRQQRDDAVENLEGTDCKRRLADVAAEPSLARPAREVGREIVPRGVCVDENLRRDDQRIGERAACLGCVHAEIKIFIGVAQPTVHHDHCALDVRLHFAHVAAGVRGHQRFAKRSFNLQTFRRNRLDGTALRRGFVHCDGLTEP